MGVCAAVVLGVHVCARGTTIFSRLEPCRLVCVWQLWTALSPHAPPQCVAHADYSCVKQPGYLLRQLDDMREA